MKNIVTHEVGGDTERFVVKRERVLALMRMAPEQLLEVEKEDWAEGYAVGRADILIEYYLLRNYPQAFRQGYDFGRIDTEAMVDLAVQSHSFD